MTSLPSLAALRATAACVCFAAVPAAAIASGGQGAPPAIAASAAELERLLSSARPGDTILIAPGMHRGFSAADIRGTGGRPVTIRAADPGHPPVFTSGVHLSDVAFVTLEHLLIGGAPANGLNIDDGGSVETPSHHVLVRHVVVRDCGGRANHDGIKLSGVEDFRVEECTIERWGRGGSAVDMVGCHRGRIERCTFRDSATDPASNGIQVKGGSRDVVVSACRFEHAGQRALNIGGSTGLAYFRPPVADGPATEERFEARDILVEGCTLIGSDAPVAFVGVDGATVRRCTIHRPARWILRILQETREPGFVPCRNGVFAENLVVYSAATIRSAVNIGPGTAPETFRFEGNYWFAEDAPQRSLPSLPVTERAGAGGDDPRFVDAERGDLRLREGSPARGRGASAR